MRTVNRFLLVDCRFWVVYLGSTCMEIYWRWGHWEKGVGCVGSLKLGGQGAAMEVEWATFHG